MKRSKPRNAAQVMPVVLALVLAACGGAETADTNTTTAAASTTSMATTTTAASTTTAGATTTAAPATTTPPVASDDHPTELRNGTYLVGSEIRPGTREADECGCLWSRVAEDGSKTTGAGEDATVEASAYAIEFPACVSTWKG